VIDPPPHGAVTDRADVVVIGDGPAGSALAAACARRGIDVVLVGTGRPWTATYGAWVDDLADVEVLADADVFAMQVPSITAYGTRHHDLDRAYGVVDNEALRTVLRVDVAALTGLVESVRIGVTHHSVFLADGRRLRCRSIIDASGGFGLSGAAGSDPAWQTAFGVVLAEPPEGELGKPMFMDFRRFGDDADQAARAVAGPTFVYALPVADGWLVEETMLAARPPVEPQLLLQRLAARLGRSPADVVDGAVRTERVEIPMPKHALPTERAQPVGSG